jgi:hypothetical protein
MSDVLDIGHQGVRHRIGRQDVVGQSGGDRAARHTVVRGGDWILDHTHAPGFFDRLQAQGTIAARAGEDNADSGFSLVFGQRAEESVDRQA